MIEMTVVCDKCGARRTFESRLTSEYYKSEDGFSVCSCNPPREVSIIKSVRNNVMDGAYRNRWHFLGLCDGDAIICPECWDKYLCAMREFDEEVERCKKAKHEAEVAYDEAATKWIMGNG